MRNEIVYRAMAQHFDAWQHCSGGDYSKLMAPRLDALLLRFGISPKSIVDLGCGTGTLLSIYAARGLQTVGVDLSRDMLREARKKLPALSDVTPATRLIRGRIEANPLAGPFDLATCFYDTLNHLSEPGTVDAALRGDSRDAPFDQPDAFVKVTKVESALRDVARILSPRGLFVFDTNNLHCYRVLWTSPAVVETPTFRIVVNPTFHEATRTGTANISVTSRGETVVVQLRERWFPDDEIETALARARLRLLDRLDINPFTPGDTAPIKTLWVASRRA